MTRQEFIQNHSGLFRDTPLDRVSDSLLVERVLVYADVDEVRAGFEIFGRKGFCDHFVRLISKPKPNIPPEIISYFTLLFGVRDDLPYGDIMTRAKANDFFHRTV